MAKGLAFAIPSADGTTCIEWAIAAGTLQWPLNMNRIVLTVKGSTDIAACRQTIAEAAIEQGCKYLFFLDDDVIVPSNVLLHLTTLLDNNNPPVGKVAAVTGIYCGKVETNSPHVYKEMGEGAYWHWKKGDTFEIANCGAGCLLIDLAVLAKLPKPWFKFVLEENVTIGEDVYFCELLRKEGYKLMAHGGVLCKHWDKNTGTMYELPADSYPMLPKEEAKGPVA